MVVAVSTQCRTIGTSLKTTVSLLKSSSPETSRVSHRQVNDELERFGLWMGNIGAVHTPDSPLSLESRLSEADDVLCHISDLLEDFQEVTGQLLEIVSGKREGEKASSLDADDAVSEQYEEVELVKEIEACVTRLFRVSTLIRQAAPSDLFAKAISRHRYDFNDQFDIAHVGEKYSKLALDEYSWLRKRLGRAITLRRHYLSYIQDHREKLEGTSLHTESQKPDVSKLASAANELLIGDMQFDSSSRPSTFFTKASSIAPGQINSQVLTTYEELDPEEDARSYTTISRSVSGDLDSSATAKIPKLEDIRGASKREFECPFCFRMKNMKSEKVWRRHVLSDLRAYVCTFPNCDAPYFSDINEWFRHEMQSHRVHYVCQLCQGSEYLLKENYLAHVKKKHAFILENADEQAALEIAQRPVTQIRPEQCPCCSDWIERLEQRAGLVEAKPRETIYVDPTVFKRHLASHLEQLALFAVPVGTNGDDIATNDAVEDDRQSRVTRSNLSALTFESARHPNFSVVNESEVEDEVDAATKGQDPGDEIAMQEQPRQSFADDISNTAGRLPTQEGVESSSLTVMEKKLYNPVEGMEVDVAVREAKKAFEASALAGVVSEREYEDLARALEHRFEFSSSWEDLKEAILLVQQLLQVSTGNKNFLWNIRWYEKLSLSLELVKVEGRSDEATQTARETIYENAERVFVTHLKTSSVKTRIYAMGGLGAIYRFQRKFQDAKDMFGSALKLFEDTYPDFEEMIGQIDDIVLYVVDIMDHAASTYVNDDQYEEAAKLLKRAIGIQKACGGGRPGNLRLLANHLGLVYRRMYRYKSFEELQKRLIEVENLVSYGHPAARQIMKDLAVYYEREMRWEDAERLWIEALDVIKDGKEHQEIIMIKSHLAKCYEKQGLWRTSERLLNDALDLSKTQYGNGDKNTFQLMETLATLYWHNGYWKEAEELLIPVVDIRTQVPWSEHDSTIRAMHQLVEVYQAQDYWGEASELCKKMAERQSSYYGSEHPETLRYRSYLTFLYLCLGKFDMAQGLGSMVLEAQTRVSGEMDQDTIITTKYLALASACLGQFDRAKELWAASISRPSSISEVILKRLIAIADVYHEEESFKTEGFLREKIRFIEYLISWDPKEDWKWEEVRAEFYPEIPEPRETSGST